MTDPVDPVDYPAAHSMDTTWFAIDRRGHVARLDSGEGGAVPLGGFPGDNNANLVPFDEVPLVAGLLRRRAETDERLAALLPDDDSLMERLAGQLALFGPGRGARFLAEFGVFSYECLEQAPIPYVRMTTVAQPLDISEVQELHPETEEKLARAVLPTEFADTEAVQPAEWFECGFWHTDYRWLAVDGRTHATPGNRDPDPDDWMEGFWRYAVGTRDEMMAAEFDLYSAVEEELAWAVEMEAMSIVPDPGDETIQ